MDFCKPTLQCRTLCNSGVRPASKRAVQYLETTYQSLSTEEREHVDRDLCGTEEPVEESDALIDLKIKELCDELDRIVSSKKNNNAYKQAVMKHSSRGHDDVDHNNVIDFQKYYLMFLRAERFDVQKAATRMLYYFKEKLELFGYSKLDCKITQNDLNDQDIAALYSGVVSITGATDNVGRLIIVVRRQQLSREPVKNLRRAVFYLTMQSVEDNEETQKRGFVGINYNIKPPGGGPQKIRQTSQVRKLWPFLKMVSYALPTKYAAFHLCYNDLSYHFYVGLSLMVLPKKLIPRLVCHYGTHIDTMCELLAYGIDADTLPITLGGDFDIEMVHDYLHFRRSLEEKQQKGKF